MNHNEPAGFTFRVLKSGEVEVLHFGRTATLLRAIDAAKFLAKTNQAGEQELQHLMARVTGNYKRGNERSAGRHERNR